MLDKRLLALLVAAIVLFRLLAWASPYLEMDGAIYLRAAADYAAHVRAGDATTTPLDRAHFAAIEYWPPLYPVLTGCIQAGGCDSLTAGRAVSWGAGLLTVGAVWLLAARLWGVRAGLIAAALTGATPALAWMAGVIRSDALYLMFLAGAWAFTLGSAWQPRRRAVLGGLLGGAALAGAYLTRFDALPAGLALLLATGGLALRQSGRARRRALAVAAAFLVGFSVLATPYVCFLSHLNGGALTLVSPQKRLGDTLEGVWVALDGRDNVAYLARYGPPGLAHLDPADPVVADAVRRTGPLLAWGLTRLPANLAVAVRPWTWPLAVLAAVTLWRGRRDPRGAALALLLAPAPVLALLSAWDPAPRYYAFTQLLLVLLAVPTLEALWDGRLMPAPSAGRLLRYAAAPALIFGGWYVPGAMHFDINRALEPVFLEILPAAVLFKWLLIGGAVAATGLLLPTRLGAGPRAGLLALGGAWWVVPLIGTHPHPAADAAVGLPPLLLALLAVCLGLSTLGAAVPPATAPAADRRRALRRGLVWAAAWGMVVALQNLGAMHAVDGLYARHDTCPAVARVLAAHPEWPRVGAESAADVLRTGHTWIPLDAPGAVPAGADLLVVGPGPAADAAAAPPGTVLFARVPATDPTGTSNRVWRIYRVISRRRPGGSESSSRLPAAWN